MSVEFFCLAFLTTQLGLNLGDLLEFLIVKEWAILLADTMVDTSVRKKARMSVHK